MQKSKMFGLHDNIVIRNIDNNDYFEHITCHYTDYKYNNYAYYRKIFNEYTQN